MQRDPIVEETRRLRNQYAASLVHDPDAIFEDIRRRQSGGGKKLVTYPPRKPSHRPAAA